jgi:hypothetical protein
MHIVGETAENYLAGSDPGGRGSSFVKKQFKLRYRKVSKTSPPSI